MGREAAEFIYGAGAINIGQDAPSHDRAGTTGYPAHQVCREMQTLNIENLGDLRPVVGKRFQFIGLPLKIRKGSGSPYPCRRSAGRTDTNRTVKSLQETGPIANLPFVEIGPV